MKHRIERVREVLKREIGDFVTREIQFAAKLVTIQSVDVTPDLKKCHVFVSAIGAPEEVSAVIPTLQSHRRAIQQYLAKRVIIKFTPHLYFKLDASVERGDRVMAVLEEINTLTPPGEPAPDDGADPAGGEETGPHDER
jgi:ribosome-binding factor A